MDSNNESDEPAGKGISAALRAADPLSLAVTSVPQANGASRSYLAIEGTPGSFRAFAEFLNKAAAVAENNPRPGGGWHAVLDPADGLNLKLGGIDALQLDLHGKDPGGG